MNRATTITHQFVDVVPDTLTQGVVYVCIPHTTALHLCLCGCGEEVVTPIKPTGWRLGFNGIAVSLHPSIGNWDFTCRSHYWITDSRVRWDRQWSPTEIAAARRREDTRRAAYFDTQLPAATPQPPTEALDPKPLRTPRMPTWLRPRTWQRPWRRRRMRDGPD